MPLVVVNILSYLRLTWSVANGGWDLVMSLEIFTLIFNAENGFLIDQWNGVNGRNFSFFSSYLCHSQSTACNRSSMIHSKELAKSLKMRVIAKNEWKMFIILLIFLLFFLIIEQISFFLIYDFMRTICSALFEISSEKFIGEIRRKDHKKIFNDFLSPNSVPI